MDDKRKRTPWFPRNTPPVRLGLYECSVRVAGLPNGTLLWDLQWDGKGFIAPVPMVVKHWRGLAKQPRA